MGIREKEVGVESWVDAQEQLGIDGGLVEEALQGAWTDADALGEPFVGVALMTQFVANKVAYVYLHSGCCLCAWLPNPHIKNPTTADKKEGEQSRLQLAVVGSTFYG